MCLQADQAQFVTGYNGGVFSVSDDNPDAGPFLTYCWTGPCKAPDVNFGELAVHMYWRLMYSQADMLHNRHCQLAMRCSSLQYDFAHVKFCSVCPLTVQGETTVN